MLFRSNRNRSVGNPDETSAERIALAPGIETISISLPMASRTILYPGSDMDGVPASDMRARSFPLLRWDIN